MPHGTQEALRCAAMHSRPPSPFPSTPFPRHQAMAALLNSACCWRQQGEEAKGRASWLRKGVDGVEGLRAPSSFARIRIMAPPLLLAAGSLLV